MKNAVLEIGETEADLIKTAQDAVSQCRWVVGECASRWTKRYSRGRTDADFAQLVGLSADQVYQRRRVFDAFGAVREEFLKLRWSHFYAALNWEDALECLRWAEENQASVGELKAWRRSLHGEDLATPPDPLIYLNEFSGPLPTETAYVQDPEAFAMRGSESPPFEPGNSRTSTGSMTSVAREEPAYTPFRNDAMSVPGPEKPEKEESVSPEQLVKRICNTVERCTRALPGEFRANFRKLPSELRQRLRDAVLELQERVESYQ